ncbi:MAG: hypothetical protein M0Q38_02810 [Bacteroidales bacterium]|jgi:hypothetical protein|nr:hypothetical protein [Bacteroidales bacterium]
MKKQTKTILIIVATLAVILVIVALFFPQVGNQLTRGTIGKVEKYHKQSMSEKDIQLRSEFVRDTTQLRKLIRGLASFAQFNTKTCRQIDSSLLDLQYHPIMMNREYNEPLLALKDFSTFLANNNAGIVSTGKMLETFYYNSESADQSVDVEKNLRDFGIFILQVVERDSVLEIAAMDIDKYIEKVKSRKKNMEDTKPLQRFRDQLLVTNLMTAAILGERTSLSRLTKYATTVNPDDQIVSAVNQLNVVNGVGNLQGAGNLQGVGSLQGVEMQSMLKLLESQALYNSPVNP